MSKQIVGFYTITSPQCYLTGAADGGFPPVGQHIKGEMGGFWIPPVKLLSSIGCTLDSEPVEAHRANGFRYGYTWVTHRFSWSHTEVKRHIAVSDSGLHVEYSANRPESTLEVQLAISSVSSWHSGLEFKCTAKMEGHTVVLTWTAPGRRLEATVNTSGDTSSLIGRTLRFTGRGSVSVDLRTSWVASRGPHRSIRDIHSYLTSTPKVYGVVYNRSLTNLLHLARTDGLGQYFSAGHPEFPWLFGIDTCYVVDHTRFAGLSRLRRAALRTLLAHRHPKVGLIPHEVTHGGVVYNAGDMEETPFFVKVYLELALDSGRASDLADAYSTSKLLLEALARHDADGDLVAEGPGIVERPGREEGAKLDVACYTALAYRSMAEAARRLGYPEHQDWDKRWRTVAHEINNKYWDPRTATYRQVKFNGNYLDTGDWTHILPYTTMIAPAERAAHLGKLAREPYAGVYGLYLTRSDRHVDHGDRGRTRPQSMPLGTGLLASALFRYGLTPEGWNTVDKIVGLFGLSGPGYIAEIAPDQGCHTQAWSYSAYVSAVIDGALRPNYDGFTNTLTLDPPRNPGLNLVFKDMWFGRNSVDIHVETERLLVKVNHGKIRLRVCGRTLTTIGAGHTQVLMR